MNDHKENKRPIVTWKRVVAFVLVIAMVVSSGLSAMIQVSISSEGDTDLARNYLIEKNEYINNSRTDRLLDKFKSLRRATDLEGYYNQACVQIAEEKYDKALESLEECLRYLEKEDGEELHEDILIKKGCLLELLDRKPEAIKVLEQSMTVSRNTKKKPEVLALLAQLYFMEMDYGNAAEYYQQVIDLAESDEDIGVYLFMYGTVEVQNQNYEKAEELFTRSMKVNNGQVGIYYYRGISRLFQGKYEDAIDDLTESIERSDMLQSSHYSRAVAWLSLNPQEYESPKYDLEEAIRYKGPDSDKDIVRQSKELLEVIHSTERKEVEYESESESESELQTFS